MPIWSLAGKHLLGLFEAGRAAFGAQHGGQPQHRGKGEGRGDSPDGRWGNIFPLVSQLSVVGDVLGFWSTLILRVIGEASGEEMNTCWLGMGQKSMAFWRPKETKNI